MKWDCEVIPMRSRVRSILVLGFAVVLAACGSGGTKSAATKPPSPAQLQARLLGAADVGSDWKLGQAINSADLASVQQSIPCVDVAVNPAVAKRLTAVTGIQFEPADRSYKHLIQLGMTGHPAQLDSDLQALFAAMDSCATASATPGTATSTVKRFTVPQLGDQRAAYVMTSKVSARSSATWYVRNAVVRVGPVAVALGLTEILATPQDKPTIGDDFFLRLLQTAVARLRS